MVNSVLAEPIHREDVLGTYSGLRPLLDSGTGRSAELSRGHTVLTGDDGLISVVGGKLTTYRKMAEEAVDAAVRSADINATECRTRRIPLVGAAGPARLSSVEAPARLVGKYGAEASRVLEQADGDPSALEPIADGWETALAELRFGLRCEGALDEDDLLDRRTRIGLVDEDRTRAIKHARAAAETG